MDSKIDKPSHNVLVVEDEQTLASSIAQRLSSEGWDVRVAQDGIIAIRAAAQGHPDLVVMEVMQPGSDCVEATKRIVSHRPVPVLMLTARDEETDVILGLSAGADDYMTKPFSMRELLARCKALVRRVERAQVIAKNSEDAKILDFGSIVIDPATRRVTLNDEAVHLTPTDKVIAKNSEDAKILDFGSIVIDPATRRVTLNDEAVHLTPTEFDLLTTWARKPKSVLTREQLLEEVWDWVDASGTRPVDSHVKALRHKLGSSTIRTVHGVGYAFEPPEQ